MANNAWNFANYTCGHSTPVRGGDREIPTPCPICAAASGWTHRGVLAMQQHLCEYTIDGLDPTPANPACGRPASIMNPRSHVDFDYEEWFCEQHADPDWNTYNPERDGPLAPRDHDAMARWFTDGWRAQCACGYLGEWRGRAERANADAVGHNRTAPDWSRSDA